jgi:hypothetical protein
LWLLPNSRETACVLWLYHSGFLPRLLVIVVISPYDSEQGLR